MSEQDEPTIQQLRDRAAQAAKLEGDNERINRENAFLKAGINPDDERLGYFVRGYDGKLEPEEIKGAAIKAGFLPNPDATPDTPPAEEAPVKDDGPSEEEQAQDNLAATVASGSAPIGEEPPVDLMDEGFSEFHSSLQSGSTRKDAAAHVIGRAIAQGVGKSE